jgi:PhnB protein
MAQLTPYISFTDNARDAMEFYQSVFGGKLDMTTFAESHMTEDKTEGEKLMHAMLVGENGITIMASDTPNSMEHLPGANISMSLSGPHTDEAELKGYWEKLLANGTATMPLDKAPWGDTFGMLTDQFGINWMVNISGVHIEE